MIKKSITVTEQQDQWIQAQITSGHYASDSEVIRDALRDKQMRSAELETLRAALIKAEASGFSTLNKEDIRRAVLDDIARDDSV